MLYFLCLVLWMLDLDNGLTNRRTDRGFWNLCFCTDACLNFMVTKNDQRRGTLALEYLSHVFRGERYELLRYVIEAEEQAKRSVERRQKSWLWLWLAMRWFDCSSTEIFRSVVPKATTAFGWTTFLNKTVP